MSRAKRATTGAAVATDLLARLWQAAQRRLTTDPDAAVLLVDARDAVRDLLGANARAEIRIADLNGDAKETKLRGFREGVQALYAALLELPARVDLTAEQVHELEKLARLVAAEGAVKP